MALSSRLVSLIRACMIFAAFSTLGFFLLRGTHATPLASTTEAEKGTLSGNASVVYDSKASGGKEVKFGSQNTSPIMGIADPQLITLPSSTQQAQLKQMASIGITSVRLDINQQWVQYNGPNSYDWSEEDTVIHNIYNAGLAPIVIVNGAASWNSLGGATDGATQPVSASEFGSWAATLAGRYGSMVKVYEIWNEPNIVGSWHPAANPTAYTADLISAYKGIKAIEPGATVISAGLAPSNTDATDINAVTFLQDMYKDGAKDYFDGVGYHPYSYPALPDTYESWSGWSQMAQATPSIRSVMTTNGDNDKKIWITEIGAPSNGPDGVGNTQEATEFTQAITDAKSTGWIASIYIYTWQDSGTDASNDEDWFGLLNFNGAQKPAYAAVKSVIAKSP